MWTPFPGANFGLARVSCSESQPESSILGRAVVLPQNPRGVRRHGGDSVLGPFRARSRGCDARGVHTDEIDAVRADGGLVHIRPVDATDKEQIDGLDERVSDRAIYLRFFSVSRHTARVYLDRLIRPPDPTHSALIATVDGVPVGVAGYELLGPGRAEVALLVDDAHQHEGIGTLLIEHLAAVARRDGIRQFVAEVLAENAAMIGVLHDLGFAIRQVSEFNVLRFTFDLGLDDAAVSAIDRRDQRSAVASLRPMLAPHSIVVIGAGDRPRSVGHEVLANIQSGGYSGDLAVVNPHHNRVLGVPSVPSVLDLPFTPELAVVAVPAAAVLETVTQCGVRGVKGVLLLSAGFGETGEEGRQVEDAVVMAARRHGMRLIGPNCLGLVNTDPAVGLDATFARITLAPGCLGLVSQSGALGIAVLAAAQRCGLGVAQFVSVGNKADVSSNDLLLAWERDDRVSVIALYLESFGNPRRFARIARRISRRKPIIAIKAGRSSSGARAGQSHTAAAAASDVVVDALFTEAGVIRVDTMEEMLDAGRVLALQPGPVGPRVAIFGNSGGPEILAADAIEGAGLTVAELSEVTCAALRRAVPSAASVHNPVDLGAGVQPDGVHRAASLLLASDEVDVVLGVFTETLVADPASILASISAATAGHTKLVVATQVGGAATVVAVPGSDLGVPVFEFPERAAAAIGLAHRWALMAAAGPGPAIRPSAVDPAGARAMIHRRLSASVDWLAPDDIARILIRYGIALVPHRVVFDLGSAERGAAELGYPVAVKLASGGVHKSELGGVRLGVRNSDELRLAFEAIRQAAPAPTSAVLIQPMAEPGVELIAGVLQDSHFGPVVMLGIGGVLADVIADRQFRLAPLSASGASSMISALRAQKILDGFRGGAAVSRPALADLLVRLAALAADLPEIAELDLNPVICRGDELVVVDARVRVCTPSELDDPVSRQLRRRRP